MFTGLIQHQQTRGPVGASPGQPQRQGGAGRTPGPCSQEGVVWGEACREVAGPPLAGGGEAARPRRRRRRWPGRKCSPC